MRGGSRPMSALWPWVWSKSFIRTSYTLWEKSIDTRESRGRHMDMRWNNSAILWHAVHDKNDRCCAAAESVVGSLP